MIYKWEAFIVNNFDEALEQNHIKAYYQPIFRALKKSISCVEALTRWEDPKIGQLPVFEIIEVLEKHKMIRRLDLHILNEICKTYVKLKEKIEYVPVFSINLSRLDFIDPGFIEEFVGTIDEYGVPHSHIRVEITESVMVNDSDMMSKILKGFKENGFRVWMDDFGSGYSSLNMLKDYPFDLLKIDMIFLKDFGIRSKQMLSAVINMAKILGIHTLTEGIETEEQYNFLLDAGCELIQGFYFSEPMNEEELCEFLESRAGEIEPEQETDYWDNVGRFNFLSANPLDGYLTDADQGAGNLSDRVFESKIPMALLEYENGITHCIYYNNEYLSRIRQLGYETVKDVEDSFNSREAEQHHIMEQMLERSIKENSVEKIDYVENGVFYTLKNKCLSKHGDKYMMAITLYTFDSDKEARKTDDLFTYGPSLFLTYNLIAVFYPESDTNETIYSYLGTEDDYSVMPLRAAVKAFIAKAVHEDDVERYTKFIDLDSLEERIKSSGSNFIQYRFRIKFKDKDFRWQTVRITRIVNNNTVGYLYTLQNISTEEERIADFMIREHPDKIGF